jgi:hypothetical protein
LDIVSKFLHHHGHKDGGSIRTNPGSKLARSFKFQDLVLQKFHYTLKPTGTNSPSQNCAVEIYNDKFAVRTRTLLFGSGLSVEYWSAALLHLVYLHNQMVHLEMKKTPFEGYYGLKPDLAFLKLFGSWVCVKQSGNRRSKLDWNDFGVFFSGTPQRIRIFSTSTSTQDSSSAVIMLNSTRPGTYNPTARPLHNCSMILAWKPTTTCISITTNRTWTQPLWMTM